MAYALEWRVCSFYQHKEEAFIPYPQASLQRSCARSSFLSKITFLDIQKCQTRSWISFIGTTLICALQDAMRDISSESRDYHTYLCHLIGEVSPYIAKNTH